jgi:hypothetical protein
MKTKTFLTTVGPMGVLDEILYDFIEEFLGDNEIVPVEVEIGETEDKICIEIRRRNDE